MIRLSETGLFGPCMAASGRWRRACGGGLVVAGFFAVPADAQELPDLQRELREMRQHYDAELKRLRRDYEARIDRLEKQVKAAESAASTHKAPAPVATAVPPSPVPAPTPAEPAANAGLEQPPAPSVPPPATPAPGGLESLASAFNPSIGVVLNGHLEAFSQNPNDYFIRGFALGDNTSPGTRGPSINESEVNFQANVDPYLFGNLTVAFEPNNTISIEEAFMQTTSLPAGFTLRAGRFFSGIGYLNEQHSHTWDFADQALPYRAFLNTQYDDDGIQLRWLAPTTQFIELGHELFLGNAFPAGGAPNQGLGTHSVFAHTGGDIGDSGSYRAGLSWLHTNAENRLTATPNGPDDTFTGKNDLLIVDGVYKWAPDGNPTETNLKLQGEFFIGRSHGLFDGLDYSATQTGFYAQAIYQFMPRWRIGLRYDQLGATPQTGALANSTVSSRGITPRRGSAMLEFNTSEFGRFRLQYNLDYSRGTPDNQGFLQYIVSLGAHGAHSY
jgi:hypothetical protein